MDLAEGVITCVGSGAGGLCHGPPIWANLWPVGHQQNVGFQRLPVRALQAFPKDGDYSTEP